MTKSPRGPVLLTWDPSGGLHSCHACVGIVDESPTGAKPRRISSATMDGTKHHPKSYQNHIKITSISIISSYFTWFHLVQDLFTQPGATKTRASEVPGLILTSPDISWHLLTPDISEKTSEKDLTARTIFTYGSVSKPCTPSEPQNSW